MIPKRRVVSGQTYSIFDDPKKSKDAHKIRDFIETHLPHAIIVGMGNPEAKSLKSDISLVLERILSDNPRAMSSLETGTILQFSVDESIAVAWENSTAAEAEMPSASPIVRRGVALAREAMDPFAVLASLCGQSRESLSLRLHPLQKYIPNEIKMKSMEDVLCSSAAQIGLDLNLAASVPWRATYLPFIPGMGLRKASALLRGVVRGGGALEERGELLQKGLLSNCVFHNAAPYLRIRASSDATQGLGFQILDDTRIMPGDYALAIDVARAAVGDTGSNSNVVIEDAIEHPEKMETMDLESFEQQMNQHEADEQGQSNEQGSHASLGKLIDTQMELVSPFGDIRPRFKDLTGEQIFWLLSGEDKSTLKKGRKVEARVRFVNEEQAVCNIPELNGLEAVIESTAVSSKQEIVNCRDYFKPGDTVVAAVLSLDSTQGLITLSTASNHLNNDVAWEYEYFAQDDEYYFIPDKKTIMQEEAALRGTTGRSRFVSRPIRHPYFKNVSVAEAAAEVSAGPVGVALIRPATKSFRRLHITMCLPCGIIWHVDVKEMGQVAASLRLATPLEVQPMPGHKFEYEDLDELVVRFIDPVSSAMRALASHRKWNGGPLLGPPKSWEEIQDDLKILKSQAPNQAAYCLAADAQRPGAFYLAHLIGSNPRREYFVVVPDGFYFRKKVYGTVEHMLVQFKKNPKGNPPPPSNYDNTVKSYSGGYHQPQAYGYA
jgi:transcription elongation factor SPT6